MILQTSRPLPMESFMEHCQKSYEINHTYICKMTGMLLELDETFGLLPCLQVSPMTPMDMSLLLNISPHWCVTPNRHVTELICHPHTCHPSDVFNFITDLSPLLLTYHSSLICHPYHWCITPISMVAAHDLSIVAKYLAVQLRIAEKVLTFPGEGKL